MREYRVVVANTEGGVLQAAQRDGWTVLNPIRKFEALDTLDDGSLGNSIGRLFVNAVGWVALAYKDV